MLQEATVDIDTMLESAKDTMTIERVFGQPVEMCTLLAVPWLARRICRRRPDTDLTRSRGG